MVAVDALCRVCSCPTAFTTTRHSSVRSPVVVGPAGTDKAYARVLVVVEVRVVAAEEAVGAEQGDAVEGVVVAELRHHVDRVEVATELFAAVAGLVAHVAGEYAGPFVLSAPGARALLHPDGERHLVAGTVFAACAGDRGHTTLFGKLKCGAEKQLGVGMVSFF